MPVPVSYFKLIFSCLPRRTLHVLCVFKKVYYKKNFVALFLLIKKKETKRTVYFHSNLLYLCYVTEGFVCSNEPKLCWRLPSYQQGPPKFDRPTGREQMKWDTKNPLPCKGFLQQTPQKCLLKSGVLECRLDETM